MKQLPKLQLLIMNCLWQADEPIGLFEITESTGLARGEVSVNIRKLRNKNLMRVTSHGKTQRVRNLYEPVISKSEYVELLLLDVVEISSEEEIDDILKKIDAENHGKN